MRMATAATGESFAAGVASSATTSVTMFITT